MPESLEPFPWAPPFFLAPPYYPHPTYHHKYPSPNGPDAYDPTTSSSSTSDPASRPSPLPSIDSHPDFQDYYSHQIPVINSYKHFSVHSSLLSTDEMEDSSQMHPEQKQETPGGLLEKRSATPSPSSDTGFPIQVEAPPLQPPTHAFNQYYHYYHHPKIPLPHPPQDPDPDLSPQIPSSTNPYNPELLVIPRSMQQPEALRSINIDQLLQPLPEASSHPYTLPTSAPYTTHPPEVYPYHYFSYFPHFARGEAKRSSHLNQDTATKTHLPDYESTKSSTFVHPLFQSSEIPDEYNLHPYIDQSNPDNMIHFQNKSPEWFTHPLLSDEDSVKMEQESPGSDTVAVPPQQPSIPPPSPNHNLPPYPYYHHHPYYHYYQMYHEPESLQSCNNSVSPASSKEAVDPPLHGSSFPTQPPPYHKLQTPPIKSMDDVPHGPLYPYYYFYQQYYQPQVSVDNQEVHPSESMSLKLETQLPAHSDNSQAGWLVRAAEAEHPSMPQSSPFHSLYFHDLIQQHLQDPFGHPDGEEVEEELNDEMMGN